MSVPKGGSLSNLSHVGLDDKNFKEESPTIDDLWKKTAPIPCVEDNITTLNRNRRTSTSRRLSGPVESDVKTVKKKNKLEEKSFSSNRRKPPSDQVFFWDTVKKDENSTDVKG